MASFWDFPTKPAPHEGTCRMFQADIVERFSRIHPATPFVANFLGRTNLANGPNAVASRRFFG